MRKLSGLIVVLALYSNLLAASELPRVFGMDPAALAALRDNIARKHFRHPALGRLRAEANRARKSPLLSVTQKHGVPPSGDKHDYMSLAPYWWPNPKTANGLPYIRRDGERNPEINQYSDHKNFGQLSSSVHTLALAYYLFGDEAYAAHAAAMLRAWFIDPRTRMNPNLQYAQAVRGVNEGRGTGLIETRGIALVVDAVGLLGGSREWTAADQESMEHWCAKFLDWMRTSGNGKQEARARNNHGSFYDVQVVSLALFTGNTGLAHRVVQEACQTRVQAQIESDGRESLELERTKAMSYSAFNLEALFQLATLGERVGEDLWHCQSVQGGGIRKALDFLAPYATGERTWPYRQIDPVNHRQLAALFLTAARKYSYAGYASLARQLDPRIERHLEFLLAGVEPPRRAAGN